MKIEDVWMGSRRSLAPAIPPTGPAGARTARFGFLRLREHAVALRAVPPLQHPASSARSPPPRDNHLLSSLPKTEWARLRPLLEAVDLEAGQMLHESGQTRTHVYFPMTAVVALLHITAEGDSMEIGMVGNEGLVGVCALMGGESFPALAVVQVAGKAYRASLATVRAEFKRLPTHRLLLRYMEAHMAQVAQAAVCSRHHSLEQRLNRLLLSTLDRVPHDELPMTHELMPKLLGVRREGVTEAALKLQDAGLIHYARGHIRVLNRQGVQDSCCECYAVLSSEYARLLPRPLDNAASTSLWAATR